MAKKISSRVLISAVVLVVLLLVSSHHALMRVRERRLRRLHPDERYGFGEVVEGIATGPQQTDG